jgi:hypothetical protein
VSIIGFQALATLPFLRKFTFWDEERNEWLPEQQKCLLLSSHFLPGLKVSGIESKFEIPFSPHCQDGCCISYIHNLVFPQRLHLSLEQVILSEEVNPHPNCQLPELQRVCWDKPSGNMLSFFNKFRTITELGFFDANEEEIEPVLKEMGWRLTKLILGEMGFSMSKILTLCPNLKFACFYDCLAFYDSSGIWPQNLFDFLEEFELYLPCSYAGKYRHPQQIPKGFFKQVCHIKNNKTPHLWFSSYIFLSSYWARQS